jgi:glycosyltransferase involved in cell wall biosynthesis
VTSKDRRRSRAIGGLIEGPLRARAGVALRRQTLDSGATVVTVNWNSEPYLNELLRAVAQFSPTGTRTIVVDNASRPILDRSVARRPDVKVVRLPANFGHWLALDIGFLLARTTYVVGLDVDAFPISSGWLEKLLSPLDRGYDVSGVHVRGGYVHPCCLAMRLERFVRRHHTFAPGHLLPRKVAAELGSGPHHGDVGSSISRREPAVRLFERSAVVGPGDVGSVWDGLVYHNFYSTRFGSRQPPTAEERRGGIEPAAVVGVWEEAVSRYLR